MSDIQMELLNAVFERLNPSQDITQEALLGAINQVIIEKSKNQFWTIEQKQAYCKSLLASITGLDVLQELLEDDTITEIMVNGYDCIFIEREGVIVKYGRGFSNRDRLEDVIQQIVSKVNRIVNESCPIVDARLQDGSRVHVVLPPIALNGPILTIRKFPKKPITMEALIERQTLSIEAADFLIDLVRNGYNLFVSGGTSSGKTTLLNVLSNYIPEGQRVITIEDSAELILTIPNLVRLEARNANIEGENEVTIRQLIRAAMRMRPDRLIIGEVRSGEAFDMLQAMNTGHDGSLSTGHGNSPRDMLVRLEMMVSMAIALPLHSIRGQIASALDIIIHLERQYDGSRKVVAITEVEGYESGEIQTKNIYEFKNDGACGEKRGRLLPTGEALGRRKKRAV